MPEFETTIIGAGVVGLAIAARLAERHGRILVLEKNEKYGMETSSRNSEVIHAGIYYPPGSLKALLCVEGRDELYTLCKKHDIPHKQLTKIIVAGSNDELTRLESVYNNGIRNGVSLELLNASATHLLEPNVRATASIFSPMSGVISAHGLMDFFYHTTANNGVLVHHRAEVVRIERLSSGYRLTIAEPDGQTQITSEMVVNAAGLHADRVAAMVGIDIDAAGYRQSFCKGSYFAVAPSKWELVSRLVYPLPQDESHGVHALKDIGGRLKFGPDMEYISPREFDYCIPEEKRNEFARAVQRIVPAITEEDITPDISGIRPKLQRKGDPPRDFAIVHEKERGLAGYVNLIGIESPGLTASPAIARYVENLLFG